MLSPAQAHRVKVEAGLENKPAQPINPQALTQYRAHQIKLQADQRVLAQIRSHQQRLKLKRELLQNYEDYLQGVLAGSHELQGRTDNVLIWCTLWTLDTGDIRRGLQLAACALQRGMETPDGFKRSLLETLSEEASKAILQAHPVDYRAELEQLWQLTEGKDLQDKIRARLAKAYGLALLSTEPEQAVQLLNQAQTLCPTIGVKGYLKQLQQGKPIVMTETHAEVFDLSTRRAAQHIGVSVPTFLKYASLYPSELPFVCFESGKHRAFRFRTRDIERFIQRRSSKPSTASLKKN
ncbi:phage terminase small subunit [uncultured Thiothrix sp.]|uniref:phage terminase small subunit n=1 Tax=uncultured Thiothrix sp. TaxID=223185 RepID=UPI002605AE32|nr:phage terminase small subunit [uncultured Thiothrix sp.]